MVRYFYSWIPPVIVATVVLLSLPPLGLIALIVFLAVALAALGALALAIVAAPYLLVRSLERRWRGRGVSHRSVTTLSLTERKRT
jgi:hypothetical protein